MTGSNDSLRGYPQLECLRREQAAVLHGLRTSVGVRAERQENRVNVLTPGQGRHTGFLEQGDGRGMKGSSKSLSPRSEKRWAALEEIASVAFLFLASGGLELRQWNGAGCRPAAPQ